MCEIEDLHSAACSLGHRTYKDPATGFDVFSSLNHKIRGACCGNGCRHCPYKHANVPPDKRAQLRSFKTGELLYESTDKNPTTDLGNYLVQDESNTSSLQAKSSDEDLESDEAEHGGLKVYTRSGDSGTSQLFTGERRGKDDAVFEAMGSVDELSAFVSQAREECLIQGCENLANQLETILATLLDVGSAIATPLSGLRGKGSLSAAKRTRTAFTNEGAAAIENLEAWIDEMSATLPHLGSFILPSGGRAATSLHVCRTVCRRAERCSTRLVQGHQADSVLDNQVCIYLNRASDYFFTAARWAAQHALSEEVQYRRSDAATASRRKLTRAHSEKPDAFVDPGGAGDSFRTTDVAYSPIPIKIYAPALLICISALVLAVRAARSGTP